MLFKLPHQMGKSLLWVVILLIAVNAWGSSGCLEEERIALLQVKAHMKYYALGKSLTSWANDTKSDCCKWYMVTCNNTTKRVTNLELSWIVDRNGGGWYINASVFLPFKQLITLDLIGNQLAGVVENGGFDKLSKLHNLEMIDLSYNQLNRSILSSLSHLSSLKNLTLDSNPLNSPPNSSGHETLSRLSNLELLRITTIHMEDTNVLSVLNLKDFINLKMLVIDHNNYQSFGPFNDINALSSLEVLDLSQNFIEGFETSISLTGVSGRITNNSHLQLRLNSIFCNMTKLLQALAAFQAVKSLELQGNNITTIDEIHALKNLSNLEDLFLGSYFLPNTFLHKDFLQSIGPMNSLKVLSVRLVSFL
ncbi:receptor-like protein 14 isoform X2 [Ipomoea triloba]|uniref:receptor-like protein 14 isoform X2 n=1 Tax=Ipomoea triloba TaxID=35885 RepID=UPI00125E4EE8|nr:receptor-like protein 14 isoform X2 [Ipomoea triloba]